MIHDLLTPEAQSDAYIWTAVLLAHAFIGAALWVLLLPFGLITSLVLVLTGYAAFECIQSYVANRILWWDCILDWCAVGLGACFAFSNWTNNLFLAFGSILACTLVMLAGIFTRSRHSKLEE